MTCLLSVNDIEAEDENDRSSSDLFLGTTKLYIVVGCVAALLALALLQASCTLYRSSKRRATKVCLLCVCVCVCIRTFSSLHIFFLSPLFSHSQVLLLSVLCSVVSLTILSDDLTCSKKHV